jgi:hypothetical protein
MLYRAYLKYEFEMTRNMDLFLEGENYFTTDSRLRMGIALDCWGKFKLNLGVETKSSSTRAFFGY